jgi:hypothetical protein
MKKICLVLFLAATLHFSSIGQNVRVGISGGLTVSDLTGPVNEMNHGVKTGFMAGLLVDVPLNAHFTFQPQLNYMQKGNLQREDANSKLYNALRYVELPFNLLYNLNTGKTVFFLGAGPSISLNVPSKKLTVPEEGESSYNDILFEIHLKMISEELTGVRMCLVEYAFQIKCSSQYLIISDYAT